ncbi:MAG TPA: hypothetical protein VMC09_10460 [Anaerolineales bacterium]|nr:hypothetical protein [Anaerolineales bacterium]
MKGIHRQLRKWPIALGLAVLVALIFTGMAVQAAPAQQTGAIVLENFLKREQIALNDQGARLKAADTVISTSQDWINQLKAAGKDTSALESALATYQTQIASAQSNHDAAAAVLAAPAGFDASGKVTDTKTALQTIINAGKPLRQAHLTLVQGTIDFRTAVQNWRAANK